MSLGPRRDHHRRCWDTPIGLVPGKPEAWVPLFRFPLLAPPKGARGPKSGTMVLVHRNAGQTFRTPHKLPPAPVFCSGGRWEVGRVVPHQESRLVCGPQRILTCH